jgi:osmoprotectant transport system substrate-binding protein
MLVAISVSDAGFAFEVIRIDICGRGRRPMKIASSTNDRQGIRALSREPGFTLTVLLTLAIAIGANSAVFSMIDAVLLQPLPYAESDRLVYVSHTDATTSVQIDIPPVRLHDWSERSSSFEAMAAYYTEDVPDTTGDRPENVRRAMEEEQIDMYWEYTGTGWSAILGHEIEDAPGTPEELYDAVAEEDAANGVVWLDPAPMNNTYALATAPGVASGLGVSTISDYAALVEEDPDEASMCAAAEFITRDDGLPGLEQDYGFELPDAQLHEMELGIIHTQLPDSDPCNFGEVFATDGEIVTNELEVLEDDLQSFPSYNVALTTREDVHDEYGDALEELFNPIAAELTDEGMQDMIARLIEEGELEEVLAEEFLEEHGLL